MVFIAVNWSYYYCMQQQPVRSTLYNHVCVGYNLAQPTKLPTILISLYNVTWYISFILTRVQHSFGLPLTGRD